LTGPLEHHGGYRGGSNDRLHGDNPVVYQEYRGGMAKLDGELFAQLWVRIRSAVATDATPSGSDRPGGGAVRTGIWT
jgi:hypothetical protein